MRLVSAILFVALTGAWALADEAKPADPKPELTKTKVPYRVVKMLPETGQVLLYDRDHASHVVAEVGQTLDGYLVDEIADDEVTLVAENGTQVILAAPPPPRVRRAASAPATPAAPHEPASPAVSADAMPIDPYAEPEPPRAPGDGGVRVASAAPAAAPTPAPASSAPSPAPAITSTTAAPATPAPPPPPVLDDAYGDPGIAAFADAVGAAPPSPSPPPPPPPTASDDAASTLAAAATGSPAPRPAAAAPTSAKPSTGSTTAGAGATIPRADLDAALANFGALAGSFRATFTADGLRLDTVQGGTLLTKAGLRQGDLITYVDGQPLRSLDDAASLYARASSVKSTTIQVVRDGKLVTLRVAIQ